jgi:hypothetical protein
MKTKFLLREAAKAVSAASIVILALVVFGPKIAMVQAKVKTLKSIKAGSITNSYLGNNAVTGGKITEGAIGSREIGDGTITNADISGSAAIDYSKLNLGSNITSANITDGTIVNADISPTAAISSSKINFDAGVNVTSGNVGIGTASPSQPFQVNDSANHPVVITSFGYVGIGTTDPSPYILNVQAAWGIAQIKSTTGTNNTYLLFTNSGGYASLGIERSTGASLATGALPYATVLANGSANAMQFGTNGDIKMTIDSIGNVGIGTNAPGYPLEVESDVGQLLRLYNASSPSRMVLRGTYNTGGDIIFQERGSATSQFGIYTTGAQADSTLGFYPADGATAAMTISQAGYVGIGTTSSPGAKLEVDGIIKTKKRSTATCNAAAEGGIYYDSDDSHFFGCNGTIWKQLDN